MPKRAVAHPESAEVTRELLESEALLRGGTLSLDSLNLRTWFDAFREATAHDPAKAPK